MASYSGTRRRLCGEELEKALLESEDEFANSDSEFEDSKSSDSESSNSVSGDNESETDENVDPPTKRKRHDSLFTWRSGQFSPVIHQFDDSNSGISSPDITDQSTPFSIFQLFFPLTIMHKIAQETNRYYNYVTKKSSPTQKSRLKKWTGTTAAELYVFFAVTLLMARHRKLTINEYWSYDPLLATPQFSEYMSRDRYLLLLRLLHFSDNDNPPERDNLYKIRPIIDHLRQIFGSLFRPFQNVCIDESLMLFKGRLSFIQYIPSKRHRFGIKLFVLCDCETGYVLDFIVYTGATTDILPGRELGVSGSVIQTLLGAYLQKGHTLWVDNWYSSPMLFDHLHKNKTNVCGTVRKNRREMPKFTGKLPKGQVEDKHTDNMMALRWMDRREVCMLTTLHTNLMQQSHKKDRQTGQPIVKPQCVIDYNKTMGAVDRSDMMLSSIESVRKSMKWYRKFFFHLLDISILNSHALYNTKTGENMTLANFHLSVIREIIRTFYIPRPKEKKGRPSAGDQPLRIIDGHFPTPVPSTPNKKSATRRCHVCSNTKLAEKKRRDTRYMCAKCDVGLCVHPCFQKYHTMLKF